MGLHFGAREANPSAYALAVIPYSGYASFEDRATGYTRIPLAPGCAELARFLWPDLRYCLHMEQDLTDLSDDRGQMVRTDHPGLDYGPSELNQPQTFVANYVYDFPSITVREVL